MPKIIQLMGADRAMPRLEARHFALYGSTTPQALEDGRREQRSWAPRELPGEQG